MKYIRYIFYVVLTLSLSALCSYALITDYQYVGPNVVSVNMASNLENQKEDEDTSNTFIQAPEEDSVADNSLVDDDSFITEEDYSDDNSQVFKSNDKIVYLSDDDIYLMSQIVYAESKGEPYEGKVAVASVILNRVLSPKFPDTVEGVVFQPYAFSCVVNGTISVVPTEECFNAVYDAIKGNDPTGDALFFYNPDIATCSWMRGIEKSNPTAIGQHVFFSL